MPFEGFPRNVRATSVPDPLFNSLLEEIEDLAEIKVTLRIVWLLGQKRGRSRYVSEHDLLADSTLLRSLANNSGDPLDRIRHGLALAVTRGTFLRHAPMEESEGSYYLLNTEENRRMLVNRTAGFLPDALSGNDIAVGPPPNRIRAGSTKVSIFSLYEDNIGTFGPLIAQQLAEAEDRYPPPWIDEAFRLAINENKRSWSYISGILRRWAAEGKGGRREPENDSPSELPGVGVKAGATLWETEGAHYGERGRYPEEDDRQKHLEDYRRRWNREPR